MKVGKLIEILKTYDPEMRVVVLDYDDGTEFVDANVRPDPIRFKVDPKGWFRVQTEFSGEDQASWETEECVFIGGD